LKHRYIDIESTVDIPPKKDPFDKIVGQSEVVKLIHAAVSQHRHVLLSGVPGIGKSMLAKAASTLLPPPTQEIRIHFNPANRDRPLVEIHSLDNQAEQDEPSIIETRFVRPEDIPFEVGIKMGFRCPRCGSFSTPEFAQCMDCTSVKRADSIGEGAYAGLFRKLDVILEPAENEVIHQIQKQDESYLIKYSRTDTDTIRIELIQTQQKDLIYNTDEKNSHVLVPRTSNRFVRVSGASPVEILGDVKHDPYGSAESLGSPAHLRVVPGAIHEAHEGILYIDEIAALGVYQKHLLTAMQDRKYAISGHNPHSSGAAVRVDDVPCDFILFAACNTEDLPKILPPLRSRIRGYGYEILLSSWMRKTPENLTRIVEFIAQTVYDDGRIPHFTPQAIEAVLDFAEEMALEMDGQRDALTLRLRELGGLVRISGDLAVNEGSYYVEMQHVKTSQQISKGIDPSQLGAYIGGQPKSQEFYGDYFF